MPRKGENIYKRKDGRWEGRYIRSYDSEHKAKYAYVYGKTYSEVKRKLTEQRGNVQKVQPTKNKSSTYGELLDCWLHSMQLNTKGHVRVYDKKEPTEENYKKLLRIVKGIAEDLEDILYRQNIESYRVPGHEVDTRRQKIIQTVPTDDKSKDNLIAVRAADGYEKGDKVLRPERIKIFKYEAPATKPTENN